MASQPAVLGAAMALEGDQGTDQNLGGAGGAEKPPETCAGSAGSLARGTPNQRKGKHSLPLSAHRSDLEGHVVLLGQLRQLGRQRAGVDDGGSSGGGTGPGRLGTCAAGSGNLW